MEVIILVIAAIAGTVIASFLNVCIDRLPKKESIISPASHCAVCHHPLDATDLIPVFSYLWRRGRCRYCQAPIPRRLFWLEVGMGALFAFLYWRYGLTIELVITAFYCSLFILLMFIDLGYGIIPNKVVYPSALLALLISIFLPQPGIARSSGAIGGGTGLGLFVLIVIASRGGMGWGDAKMAALIGLVTGFPLVFVALFLAIVSGGLTALLLLLLKIKKRKETVPFAPFLSLGTMATLLWGKEIVAWYLRLL
ncbi:MAG: type prepilin leader peptidase family protein [Dehalococcoidales bacterium]|nr:type prepilin leader peptidase family protein [Dehalococcoidales bacterium]